MLDEAVELAVENQLLHAESVPAHALEVACIDGVVTLAGRVDTLLAEQGAIERARRVKGVRAVVDQINVWPERRPDAAIRTDIERELKAHPATEALGVTAQVEGGEVTLAGVVDSYAEKMLAERVAKGVLGVTELSNRIEARPATARSDAAIKADIEGLLAAAVELDDVDLEVFVDHGKARLVGPVATDWQKELARAKAMLAGAHAVDIAGVDVDWDERDGTLRRERYRNLTPEAVEENIATALRFEPDLAGETVDVAVQSGVATLSGDVRTLRAKNAAERVAELATGVVGVRNRLKVESDEQLSDEQVADRVRQALLRDAIASRHEIIVRTRSRHVHLYGLVDSEYEKARAGWTASGQPNVVHVANYLTVPGEWTPKSDDAIKEDLETKLEWTLCCGAQTIDVTVEDGVAVMRGEVGTWHEWQAAMDLALEAGARRPHNLLEVVYRPHPKADDAYVEH